MFTFASFGQGSSPLLLPGIEGGYDLDTGTIATVNVAVTGSVGIGQTTLLIPTAVQLTGTTIYFQNLFASSLALPGFTNTVVETIVP